MRLFEPFATRADWRYYAFVAIPYMELEIAALGTHSPATRRHVLPGKMREMRQT